MDAGSGLHSAGLPGGAVVQVVADVQDRVPVTSISIDDGKCVGTWSAIVRADLEGDPFAVRRPGGGEVDRVWLLPQQLQVLSVRGNQEESMLGSALVKRPNAIHSPSGDQAGVTV